LTSTPVYKATLSSLSINPISKQVNNMYKTILAFLVIALTTGCSTYSGTQSTAEMEFCWERGMNFQWIEEFDAGCVDPIAQSTAIRISKIKWLEKNLGTVAAQALPNTERNI